MWRDFDVWDDFPPPPSAAFRAQYRPSPVAEAVNNCADIFLETAMAAAPLFYVALALAYLAVALGIL